MKNRLEEIEKQSYTEVMHERGGTYMAFDKQKFAELIVRECADKVHELIISDGNEFPMKSVSYRLKQHFGVEE